MAGNKPKAFHCLEAFKVPPEVLGLPDAERHAAVNACIRSAGPEGFGTGGLTQQASIARGEELAVIGAMAVVMGGPLLWIFGSIAALVRGPWSVRAAVPVLSLILARHPMPGKAFSTMMTRSPLTAWMYRYFSYRFVWCDDDRAKCTSSPAWFGAAPPHGVLPFANILSIPALNSFTRDFVGAPASVVFQTPFLRYMTLYHCVPVDGRSITRTTASGVCVGIVPDGVAGIFKCKDGEEVVAMRHRKGLARLALKTGTPIVAAYSFGNTQAFSAWYDSFGIMEAASRKLQASLFFYWGRWGLPVPHRTQITMALAAPIEVEKVEAPTDQQVDELHQKLLDTMTECFDRHKDALGWGHKTIIFV